MPQFGFLSHGDVYIDLPQYTFEGFKVKFKVVTRDKTNHLDHKEGSKVVIQGQSSRRDVTPVEVKDNRDGSYSASFVANQVGEVIKVISYHKRTTD